MLNFLVAQMCICRHMQWENSDAAIPH